MMIDFIHCITGFTFFIILPLPLKEKSVSAQSCQHEPDFFGRLKGNCQHKGITSIPQNLNTKIKVLDISFNTISNLNKDDLKNYPELERIIMKDLPLKSFPGGFFQHTSYMKMVNISNTQITNLNEIPPSVTVLNFTFCNFETVDLSHLVNLEQLFMRNSEPLKKFPTVPTSAPLQVLDLKYCDLTEADYRQIAPFCRLRYVGINSTKLTREEHVVRCCGLRKWAITWNMTGYKGQNCSRTEAHPYCSALGIKFDEESIEQYRDCISRLRVTKYVFIVIGLTVGVIVIVVLATAGVLYHHFKVHVPKTRSEDRESSTVTEEALEAEDEGNFTDSDQT